MGQTGFWRLGFGVLLLSAAIASAQTSTSQGMHGPGPIPGPGPAGPSGGNMVVPPAARAVLQTLASRAGVIFAGHVVDLIHNERGGYVDIVFAVERPVRGCSASTRYVLREWAGLWAEDPQRYLPGQRLLMILAPRGPSGMSAPVGGMAGRLPLIGVRNPPVMRGGVIPPDTPAEAALEEAVDLRWIEAAAVRRRFPGPRPAAGASASSPWPPSPWS